MKQVQLFNGVVIDETSDALKCCVVKHVKNEGTKKVDSKGKERIVGRKDVVQVTLFPRTAGEGKTSIGTLFPEYKGQELLAFEVEQKRELAEAVLKDLSGKIMSGEYVFGAATKNNRNGNYNLKFKRAAVRVVREVSAEDACKALGITMEQAAKLKAASVKKSTGDKVETLQLVAAA